MGHFNFDVRICMEGLCKIIQKLMIAGNLAKIRTQYTLIISLENYNCNELLQDKHVTWFAACDIHHIKLPTMPLHTSVCHLHGQKQRWFGAVICGTFVWRVQLCNALAKHVLKVNIFVYGIVLICKLFPTTLSKMWSLQSYRQNSKTTWTVGCILSSLSNHFSYWLGTFLY
jgi:hypothetical protein